MCLKWARAASELKKKVSGTFDFPTLLLHFHISKSWVETGNRHKHCGGGTLKGGKGLLTEVGRLLFAGKCSPIQHGRRCMHTHSHIAPAAQQYDPGHEWDAMHISWGYH